MESSFPVSPLSLKGIIIIKSKINSFMYKDRFYKQNCGSDALEAAAIYDLAAMQALFPSC